MAQQRAALADGVRQGILFNVHVEGVQHDLDVGTVHRPDIGEALVRGVDHVAFKAVERFHAERDAVIGGKIRKALHPRDAPIRIGGLVGLRRTLRRPVGIAVSYTHLDVYKRQGPP